MVLGKLFYFLFSLVFLRADNSGIGFFKKNGFDWSWIKNILEILVKGFFKYVSLYLKQEVTVLVFSFNFCAREYVEYK